MRWLSAYLTSSIGKKQLMAVTGVVWILYVIGHLAGNLTIFAGRHAINAYAVGLRDLSPLLWAARLGLFVTLALHVVTSGSLYAANRRARGRRYQVFRTERTTFYARSMAMSGLFLFLFIGYHLLHFTFGAVHGESFHLVDPEGRHDVYAMVVLSFQNPLISAVYVASMALLAMHLAHGLPSFLQTLGVRDRKYQRGVDLSGPILAVVLLIGYAAIPLAVMIGYLAP